MEYLAKAQTNWSLSVWKAWAEEHSLVSGKSDELHHKLNVDFRLMKVEDMNLLLCS